MHMRNHNEHFPGESEEEDFPQETDLTDEENWTPEELEERAASIVGELEYLEPDETSEDVLREITTEIRHKMSLYGVRGLSAATHESLVDLWHQMEMSSYLVDDLVFFTLDHKQRTLYNPFAKVSFNDLGERSSTVTNNPYILRTKIAENVAPNLVKLGFNQRQAYRWALQGSEERTQAVRRLGWLVGQPFMNALPELIKSEEAAQGSNLKMSKVLSLATQEVKKQLDIHRSKQQKSRFNHRISYERDLYQAFEKTLQNTLNMCEIVFHGKKL